MNKQLFILVSILLTILGGCVKDDLEVLEGGRPCKENSCGPYGRCQNQECACEYGHAGPQCQYHWSMIPIAYRAEKTCDNAPALSTNVMVNPYGNANGVLAVAIDGIFGISSDPKTVYLTISSADAVRVVYNSKFSGTGIFDRPTGKITFRLTMEGYGLPLDDCNIVLTPAE